MREYEGNLARAESPGSGAAVTAEKDRLDKMVHRSIDMIGQLRERLDRVLAPDQPRAADKPPAGRLVGGPSSPLASELRGLADIVDGGCDMLGSLLSRLDV